jgi:plastocyanin
VDCSRSHVLDGRSPLYVGADDWTFERPADFPEGANAVKKLVLLAVTLTKVGLAGLVLVPFIPAISRAIGGTKEPLSKSLYEVRGQVRLLPPDPGQTLEDGSGVVVWLASTQTGSEPRPDSEPPHYQIMQYHKKFEPPLLVVPTGSIVEFRNHDPWFHNVFSLSRSRQFNLGFYQAGVLKAVKFDRAGVSYLFCSIHPEMMGVVLTVDSWYFGVSDTAGHISIGNVPPGKYLLHAWYANAPPQALEAARRAIFVRDDRRSLPAISIAVSRRISKTTEN